MVITTELAQVDPPPPLPHLTDNEKDHIYQYYDKCGGINPVKYLLFRGKGVTNFDAYADITTVKKLCGCIEDERMEVNMIIFLSMYLCVDSYSDTTKVNRVPYVIVTFK